jgi:mRNA interferase MazF
VEGKVITPGDVLLITLPSHDPRGHEQEGSRPAIVAGVPKGEVIFCCSISWSTGSGKR